MRQKERDASIRERLLDEAEALFAEKGYNTVSVREIIAAANCNLAAINYYFGTKENLYLEVFRSRWIPRARLEQEYFWGLLANQKPLSLSAVVKSLAQTFLEGPLRDEETRRHHQLISREMDRPSEAADLVHEQAMKPFFAKLAETMRPLLPQEFTDEQVMLNIMSVFALVLHFQIAREGISRNMRRPYDANLKAQLVEHITRFSLTGLGLGCTPEAETTRERTET
jgi:TetR/AcrR family transcriptional regulator, regulator of cefoperazone and chloramphenicol sensitivity